MNLKWNEQESSPNTGADLEGGMDGPGPPKIFKNNNYNFEYWHLSCYFKIFIISFRIYYIYILYI